MRLVVTYNRAVQNGSGGGDFIEWGEETNNVEVMPNRAQDTTEGHREMLFVV